MSDERKHKWWHWLFEMDTSIPYRFVDKWYGSKVEYQNIYCSICRRVVRVRYHDKNYDPVPTKETK